MTGFAAVSALPSFSLQRSISLYVIQGCSPANTGVNTEATPTYLHRDFVASIPTYAVIFPVLVQVVNSEMNTDAILIPA